MIRTTGLAVVLAVAVAGAGCETNDTEGTTPSDGAEKQASSDGQIVHATLSLGGEHELQFVEFKPGVVGVIEKGRIMLDPPVVTAELKDLPWLDLYRHFAGASSRISEGMAAAQARVAAKVLEPMSATPRELGTENLSPLSTPPAEVRSSAGDGPHFYDDWQQAWFRKQFCTGSWNRDCVQGFQWARAWSSVKIGKGTAKAMVGSEGKVSGRLTQYWYDCPWLIGQCWWLEFGHADIAPGFYTTITESGGNAYIQWELTGPEASTQVSLATYY
jgi:hypothetical protein